MVASRAAMALRCGGTAAVCCDDSEGESASPVKRAVSEATSRKIMASATPARASAEGGREARKLMERSFGGWGLDTLALAQATGNRPLSALGMYLFDRLGLVQEFALDQDRLLGFFATIERGYDDGNPYHNRSHAAAVMHSMHALVEMGSLSDDIGGVGFAAQASSRSAQLRKMACLLAAAVHDYEHKGVSNDFLVKTGHERASRYEGKHVNERHHVEAAFEVLSQPEYNFLEQLSGAEFDQLHGLIVDLVLSTDMAQHGKVLQAAREAFGPSTEVPGADTPRDACKPAAAAGDARVLLQLAMKCADLGHLALDWELHSKWVGLLEQEFFLQGDREKEMGLPVSFCMDRCKAGPTKCQVGFFDGVVLPLFRLLAQAAPGTTLVLKSVEANFLRWKELEAHP